MSTPLRVVIGVAFIVESIAVAVTLIIGHWAVAAYAVTPLVVILWSFGPMDVVRTKTTARLSRSQTLALGLLALVGYWLARFFIAADGSVYVGVGIIGMLIWLILTVRREGWSKRFD